MEAAPRIETLTIRDYVPADQAGCLEVFDTNVPEYFSLSEREEFLEFLARLPGRYAVVCAEDGRIVGCGGVAPSRSDARGADLTWGMVHGAMHGRGIGRKLTLERLSWARDMPAVSTVYLNTSHLTEVFYEKLGFRTISKILNGYRPGLHRCDMQWDCTTSML